MFEQTFSPRFVETDALGHINNTVLPVWFEQGRDDIFKIVHPAMTVHDWPLILAKIEVSFEAQIYYGLDVTVKTSIKKLGNSSITITHEVWQKDKRVASGTAVMVYFDFKNNQSCSLPANVREQLEKHIIKTEV